jgi:hypothetical protein
MAEFSNESATLASSQLKSKPEAPEIVVAGVSSKWGGRRLKNIIYY